MVVDLAKVFDANTERIGRLGCSGQIHRRDEKCDTEELDERIVALKAILLKNHLRIPPGYKRIAALDLPDANLTGAYEPRSNTFSMTAFLLKGYGTEKD